MKPIIMPTPNFGYRNEFGALGGRGVKGRHGHKVKAIVFHVWEGLWTKGTRDWFFKVGTAVSYNDVILKNGDWVQLVDPNDPAWANGGGKEATWSGIIKTKSGAVLNPNLYTHAISREGFHREMTIAQEKTLIYVARFRAEQHELPLVKESFIGHKDISPKARPNCPGSGLNWTKVLTGIMPPPTASTTVHTVVKGDVFIRLARQYGVTVAELAKANPHIKNPGMIFPGDILNIPVKEHIVVKGEAFFMIAQYYGVTVPQLIGANPHIQDPGKIYPGDKLIIPKKK
jgi:LysM repeat protein